MTIFNLKQHPDHDLKTFHEFMIESTCNCNIKEFASLAIELWQEVLKELDKRKLVKLCSGNYNDAMNARIKKLW